MSSQEQPCDTCTQIRCQQCEWIASDKEAFAIVKGELTCCPVCQWQPSKA